MEKTKDYEDCGAKKPQNLAGLFQWLKPTNKQIQISGIHPVLNLF